MGCSGGGKGVGVDKNGMSYKAYHCTPASLNTTQVSLNRIPASLFTVSSQMIAMVLNMIQLTEWSFKSAVCILPSIFTSPAVCSLQSAFFTDCFGVTEMR